MTTPSPNNITKDPNEMMQPQREGFSIGNGDSRTATAKQVRCKFDNNDNNSDDNNGDSDNDDDCNDEATVSTHPTYRPINTTYGLSMTCTAYQ